MIGTSSLYCSNSELRRRIAKLAIRRWTWRTLGFSFLPAKKRHCIDLGGVQEVWPGKEYMDTGLWRLCIHFYTLKLHLHSARGSTSRLSPLPAAEHASGTRRCFRMPVPVLPLPPTFTKATLAKNHFDAHLIYFIPHPSIHNTARSCHQYCVHLRLLVAFRRRALPSSYLPPWNHPA
jgi:hypothetical protein